MWLGAVVVHFVEAYVNIWSKNIPVRSQQVVSLLMLVNNVKKKKSLDHFKPQEAKVPFNIFQSELFQ